MEDLGRRLARAGADLETLRTDLAAGEPWALSSAYGTGPEAEWGPREVLAHIGEMVGYWTSELRRVVAGDGRAAVPFGRLATDPDRLARIGHDRERDAGSLLDEIRRGLDETRGFVSGLSGADLDRVGAHPTRGDLTVSQALDRFLISHLEEHVSQLRSILGTPPSR